MYFQHFNSRSNFNDCLIWTCVQFFRFSFDFDVLLILAARALFFLDNCFPSRHHRIQSVQIQWPQRVHCSFLNQNIRILWEKLPTISCHSKTLTHVFLTSIILTNSCIYVDGIYKEFLLFDLHCRQDRTFLRTYHKLLHRPWQNCHYHCSDYHWCWNLYHDPFYWDCKVMQIVETLFY